jgi:hypothetical protein
MPDRPEIVINLTKEEAKLWSCGRCKALTLREDADLHVAWHEQIGDSEL